MQAPAILQQTLRDLLPTARVKLHQLSLKQTIALWLIDPDGMDVPLTGEETDAIFENPPYWSFCWGSGKALAQLLFEKPEWIRGKTVLDFGSGSGVVAIAAAKAGAKEVIACDIDPLALAATRHNARRNNVELTYLNDFFKLQKPVDVLLAADVLYDPENLPLVKEFCQRAGTVLLADSRVKDFSSPGFTQCGQVYSVTEPDLGEIEDVKTVRFYCASSF